MKILLINDYGTPTGGAELMLLGLRNGLRRRGHDARLFASWARPGPASSLADYECLGTTSRFRTLLQTANPWAYHRLRRVLAEFCPDIVHAQIFLTQLSPLILPLLRDVPSIYHAVWYRAICPVGTKKLPDGTPCGTPAGAVCYRQGCLPLRDWAPLMVQMTLWRRWRNVFDLIVANGESVRNHLIAEGIRPITVVPNGAPVRPPRPPLTPPPVVAFAGRLIPKKGVDVLVRAFAQVVARVPRARLLVAGHGPERAHVDRLVADLGLSSHVSMLGHLPRSELERRFDLAWVQVVPSRYAEPFGLVATEAMMRGTAVVASRVGGLPNIVLDGRTGVLVPAEDPEALAGALLGLLDDRDRAERLGRAGREVALAHFTEAAHVDRMLELYQTLCPKGQDR